MPSARRKSGMLGLLAIGLEDAARWQIDGKKLKTVGDKKARWRNLCDVPNTLYAFNSGEEVLYIGKTTQTLKKRFVGYCDPGNGRATNYKCHKGIRELLSRGEEVRILVLPSDSSLKWNGIKTNLAAGLEDNLVKTFKPKWNGSNKHLRTETSANEQDLDNLR